MLSSVMLFPWDGSQPRRWGGEDEMGGGRGKALRT